MKVVYEHKRAMTLIGFSKRIRQSEGYVQCPVFWTDYARRYTRLWQGAEPENAQEQAVLDNAIGQYALCVMDGPDEFEYVIAGDYRGGEVPEGMKLYTLPESEYAVFTGAARCPRRSSGSTRRCGASGCMAKEWPATATAIRRSRSIRRATRSARTTSAASGCR